MEKPELGLRAPERRDNLLRSCHNGSEEEWVLREWGKRADTLFPILVST